MQDDPQSNSAPPEQRRQPAPRASFLRLGKPGKHPRATRDCPTALRGVSSKPGSNSTRCDLARAWLNRSVYASRGLNRCVKPSLKPGWNTSRRLRDVSQSGFKLRLTQRLRPRDAA